MYAENANLVESTRNSGPDDLPTSISSTRRVVVAPTLSVVVCSHNPRASYLARVMQGLEDQTLGAAWELLIVDNVSETPIAGQMDLSWHRAAAARVLRKAWMSQPWSAGMFRAYLRHALPLPVVTMVSGAAGTLRRMRTR